jgi:hypothetical protein
LEKRRVVMKFVGGLVTVLLVVSCTATKKEGEQKAGWPSALRVKFVPDDRVVACGSTLKGSIKNNTGEKYSFEWTTEGKCGKLEVDSKKSYEATLLTGQCEKDCQEKLTIKAMGDETTYQAEFNISVAVPRSSELVLRPDPIPESWLIVNDYDKTSEGKELKCVTVVGGKKLKKKSVGLAMGEAKSREKTAEEKAAEEKARSSEKETEIVDFFDDVKLNLLEAPFAAWTYESGICSFVSPPKEEAGVLALSYDIPYDDAFCGYFENLAMDKSCESGPFDARDYETLTFIVKSGDDQEHKFVAELVPWERFAEFHQGEPRHSGTLLAGKEWKRYELPLAEIMKDPVERQRIKSVSFKIKREPNYPDSGVVLLDNVAFIKKAEAK